MSQDTSQSPKLNRENPYAERDLDELPHWWRQNVEEFQQYNLRPYRPPRFVDGVLVPPVIDDLEEDLDVKIRLQANDPDTATVWEIKIDGESAGGIDKRRDSEGYSEFGMTAAAFKQRVRSHVMDTVE